MNDINRLYRDSVRRHAAEPVGYRMDIDATHQYEEYNPQCGDRILILLRINDGQLEAAAFEGEACAICMASASLLCETTPGKPVGHLSALHERLRAALGSEGDEVAPEELKPLLGVKPYPSRIGCAILPWSAASKAL